MPRKASLKFNQSSNVVALNANSTEIHNRDFTIKVELRPFIEGHYTQDQKTDQKFVGFKGQPLFVEQIKPSLQTYINAVKNAAVPTYLNSLFKYVDELGDDAFDLSKLNQEIINGHSNWLIRNHGISASNMRTLYHMTGNGLIRELAAQNPTFKNLIGGNLKPIKYPAISISKTTQTTKKKVKGVSHFAAEYAVRKSQEYLREIDTNPYSAYAPENTGDHACPKMHMHMFLELAWDKLMGEEIDPVNENPDFWFTKFGLEQRPFDDRGKLLTTGCSAKDLQKYLFPDVNEAAATATLISYETGWVDTVNEINLSTSWFTTDAEDRENIRASDSVTMFARRPKTHRYYTKPKSAVTSGSYGSAFWAVNRIRHRSKQLRIYANDLLKINTLDAETKLRLEEAACYALSYITHHKPISIKGQLAADAMKQFIVEKIKKPSKKDQDLSAEQRAEIASFSWKDLRDVSLEKEFERTGGDIFAVKKKAGHKSERTTTNYLQSRQLKNELFGTFAKVTGIVFDEVSNGYEINQNILRARFIKDADLTAEERANLSGLTISGAHCRDIENPPSEIGNLGKGHCQQQSCILCPNAVFIPEEPRALKYFARRYADLKIKALNLPPNRFLNSQLEAELKAMDTYKDFWFADRAEEFEEIVEARITKLTEMRRGAA